MFDLRPQPPRTVALRGLVVAACTVALAGCGGAAQDGSSQTGKGSADERSAGSGNSDGFEATAGDNSIQEFGKEVAGSDLRQADEAVAALFRAVRSDDWSAVCARYLSRQNVEAFKKLAKMTPHIKGASCPKVLGRLNATGEKPTAPTNGLGAIRIEGNRGFGLYRGTDGKGYAISLKKEDGRWKLNALGPTPLES